MGIYGGYAYSSSFVYVCCMYHNPWTYETFSSTHNCTCFGHPQQRPPSKDTQIQPPHAHTLTCLKEVLCSLTEENLSQFFSMLLASDFIDMTHAWYSVAKSGFKFSTVEHMREKQRFILIFGCVCFSFCCYLEILLPVKLYSWFSLERYPVCSISHLSAHSLLKSDFSALFLVLLKKLKNGFYVKCLIILFIKRCLDWVMVFGIIIFLVNVLSS